MNGPNSPSKQGLFVTGTGTDVGKSVVAASIVAALTASGKRVAAFKPAVSGLDDAGSEWLADHELLAKATGWQAAESVCGNVFGPSVSPHLAAELAATVIDTGALLADVGGLKADAEVLICEGVGGLMVPLTLEFSVLDLMIALDLPVVVVANATLGTINATRLTVDRLRLAGLQVAAVVLNRWPAQPSALELSNRDTLTAVLAVDVVTFGDTTPDQLAAAGSALPLDAWLSVAT
ncbi:MAG: dethiobiotin synthase [Thermoleophilaceae bacterium]|nr:dethiobiotin synthase [Thermoleophilaceae bacterium]